MLSDQLAITAAVTLLLVTLLLLRWVPSWLDLVSAAAAAVLIDMAINGHGRQGLDPVPHACPCTVALFIGVLAVIHAMRSE